MGRVNSQNRKSVGQSSKPAAASSKPPNNKEVKAWLEKKGRPLEMRVARSLTDAGFSVTNGSYWTDSSSGKTYEVDVLANSQVLEGNSITSRKLLASTSIEVEYVIEAKSLDEHSWIVLKKADGDFFGTPMVGNCLISKDGFKLVRRLLQAPIHPEASAFACACGSVGWGIAVYKGKE
jgi:predicted SPOUT superfamily RNA methylase MTH1